MYAYLPKMLVIGTQFFGTLPGKNYMKMVKATLRQKYY